MKAMAAGSHRYPAGRSAGRAMTLTARRPKFSRDHGSSSSPILAAMPIRVVRFLGLAATVFITMFFGLLPILVGATPVEALPRSSLHAPAGVDAIDNPSPNEGGQAPQQGSPSRGESSAAPQGGQTSGQSQGQQSQGQQPQRQGQPSAAPQGGQLPGQSQGEPSQGRESQGQPAQGQQPQEFQGEPSAPQGGPLPGPSQGQESLGQPSLGQPRNLDGSAQPGGPGAGPQGKAAAAAGAAAMANGGLFGRSEVPAAITLRLGVSVGEPASGSPVTVQSRGLQPSSVVTVTVYSDPMVIASGNVDSAGVVNIDTELPSGLVSGIHSVVVSGVGASGEDIEVLNALKVDQSGVVTAVGKPGDALGVNPDGGLVERSLEAGRPIYSPSSHPAAVAAVAVTGAVVAGVAGASAVGAASAAGSVVGSAAAGGTEGAASGHAAANNSLAYNKVFDPKDLVVAGALAVAVGPGDRSPTWRVPGTHRLHDALARITIAVSRFSLILPRAISDGTWARAMFGTNALLLWLAAVVVGIVSLMQSGFTVVPGSIEVILGIILLGILDAMAGFIAWATISIGALVTLHVHTLQDCLTIVGVGCLAISLSFFANYLRPLRRVGHTGLVGLWDRFADYVILPCVIAFAAAGIAKALNGLSGLEIVSQEDIFMIQIVAGVTVVVRLALEDVLGRLYPLRCAEAAMPITQPPRTGLRLAAIVCRTVITYLLVAAFVGNTWMAMIAAVVLSVPLVLGVYQSELPTVPGMNRWLPSGITKILFTTLTGVLLAAYLFTAPAVEGLLPGLLVLLLIPSAIITSLHVLAPNGVGWSNVWPKRLLGVPVYILVVGVTTGAIAVNNY